MHCLLTHHCLWEFSAGKNQCVDVSTILAYTDYINIIGRIKTAMMEAFVKLEEAGTRMHLQLNQGKQLYVNDKKRLLCGPQKFRNRIL